MSGFSGDPRPDTPLGSTAASTSTSTPWEVRENALIADNLGALDQDASDYDYESSSQAGSLPSEQSTRENEEEVDVEPD